MMRTRLCFWLAALDVSDVLHAPLPVYLWLVRRASNATDWGECAACGEGEPW